MPSNINRQIHALEYTVGRRKVDVMAERCLAINPEVDVRARHVFYSADTDEELLAEGYDYLLDCIDRITSYNVCYTKLLRGQTLALGDILFQQGRFLSLLADKENQP